MLKRFLLSLPEIYRYERETVEQLRPVRRGLDFWSGKNPEFDASILMTAYKAEDTLEEAIGSIQAQRGMDGLSAQLIVTVDPSGDGTLSLARSLATKSPAWLKIEVVENPFPNVSLGGRRTARSNFLNGYARIRGEVVLFLNCDDAWRTRTKLVRQIDYVRRTGRGVCTSLETAAARLKKLNDDKAVLDPFSLGNTILTSSFAMPYRRLDGRSFWWTAPFLDWPMFCAVYDDVGIDRLTDEVTFYRIGEGGSWSAQSAETKARLERIMMTKMILAGPYSFSARRRLWRKLAQHKW